MMTLTGYRSLVDLHEDFFIFNFTSSMIAVINMESMMKAIACQNKQSDAHPGQFDVELEKPIASGKSICKIVLEAF